MYGGEGTTAAATAPAAATAATAATADTLPQLQRSSGPRPQHRLSYTCGGSIAVAARERASASEAGSMAVVAGGLDSGPRQGSPRRCTTGDWGSFSTPPLARSFGSIIQVSEGGASQRGGGGESADGCEEGEGAQPKDFQEAMGSVERMVMIMEQMQRAKVRGVRLRGCCAVRHVRAVCGTVLHEGCARALCQAWRVKGMLFSCTACVHVVG